MTLYDVVKIIPSPKTRKLEHLKRGQVYTQRRRNTTPTEDWFYGSFLFYVHFVSSSRAEKAERACVLYSVRPQNVAKVYDHNTISEVKMGTKKEKENTGVSISDSVL